MQQKSDLYVITKAKELTKYIITGEGTEDPFWSEVNQGRLKESIKKVEAGHYTAHELIDVDD